MEHTWEMGELRVTVDGPEGIGSPTFSIRPTTPQEFRAWIDKLGGVENFEHGGYTAVLYGKLDDEILVLLTPPEEEARPHVHPLIAEFEQRKAELASR